MERKFLDFSLGANVPWNESSTGAKVLSMVFSLPGTKVQRNEKASYQNSYVYGSYRIYSYHGQFVPWTIRSMDCFDSTFCFTKAERVHSNHLLLDPNYYVFKQW